MTGETAAELRARLGALAEAATDGPWDHRQYPLGFISSDKANIAQTYDGGTLAGEQHANGELIVALVNAWPAIDGYLARLAAAEAVCETLNASWEADSAAEQLWSKAPGWPYPFLDGPQPILEAKAAAGVALDTAFAAWESLQ